MLNLRWILLLLIALSLNISVAAQPARANHCQPSMAQMMPSDAMQDCKVCAADVNHCSTCVSALPLMPLQSAIFAADAIQIAAPVVIFQSLTSPPLLPPPVLRA